jgi:hypothetical protein
MPPLVPRALAGKSPVVPALLGSDVRRPSTVGNGCSWTPPLLVFQELPELQARAKEQTEARTKEAARIP